mgnify:CR=1 FL=1
MPREVWGHLGQLRFTIKPGKVLTSYGEVVEERVGTTRRRNGDGVAVYRHLTAPSILCQILPGGKYYMI